MSAMSATVSNAEFGSTFPKGEFEASVYVSEQMNRQLTNMVQDFAYRCVAKCAEHYHFDAEEAYRLLGLGMVKVERKAGSKEKPMKVPKEKVAKAAFPLPYNGEFKEECCYALRQNNGLYTQCLGVRKGDAKFCKGCASTMQKTGAEMPEYGTIQQRMAVDIFEYVDPKGRKPTAYAKVMKKYKITEEQVLAEAAKQNLVVNEKHFEVISETKRGRPKSEKAPKEKGAKGRPKKEKKVLQIDGDEEDLFATLLANAAEEEIVVETKKSGKSEEEKEAEKKQKEAEKKQKEEQRLKEKAEKEAKLAAEKAEKEAKKEAERLAKEAKKKAEEEEKATKKAAAEKAKAEKAAEKTAKSEKPKSSKSSEKPKEEAKEDEEPDVVKKIEFEGNKYLKSKKTGIVYDYNKYVEEGDQVVVGKWNESANKIDFEKNEDDDEEEEEEYDM